jgi:hypothetical protein
MSGQQELVLARPMENDNEDSWRTTMKTLTRLAAASILTLSVIAPAFAAGEEDTLLERNTYTAQVRHNVRAHRAAESFAYAPAGVANYSTQDFGIESQR